MSSITSTLFSKPLPLFAAATLLRAGMLLYGLWQDANSPVKYTDIDYLVFTDAARFTFSPASSSSSPYTRETYRYTPLLAWMLYPTTAPGSVFWFCWGKILFAAADLAAGWLLVRILRAHCGLSADRAHGYSAIWLLNPMVATISTRGSSEGLLGVMVAALLWAALSRRVALAGFLLGLGVHFKIYPFIYAPALVWWMDADKMGSAQKGVTAENTVAKRVFGFFTGERIKLALVSLVTFGLLNALMYALYGMPFIIHTFLHHVTRVDHRHNFSPYNILLYLASAEQQQTPLSALDAGATSNGLRVESLAFLPQILLSTILIPFVGAKKDLPATLMAQTFAFVTFNKVCTSQYFLWYQIFLPLYLPNSSFLRHPRRLGLPALLLWVVGQALWLYQGYGLEFLGESTFVPGLWLASLLFFLVNCWILGVVIGDFAAPAPARQVSS